MESEITKQLKILTALRNYKASHERRTMTLAQTRDKKQKAYLFPLDDFNDFELSFLENSPESVIFIDK